MFNVAGCSKALMYGFYLYLYVLTSSSDTPIELALFATSRSSFLFANAVAIDDPSVRQFLPISAKSSSVNSSKFSEVKKVSKSTETAELEHTLSDVKFAPLLIYLRILLEFLISEQILKVNCTSSGVTPQDDWLVVCWNSIGRMFAFDDKVTWNLNMAQHVTHGSRWFPTGDRCNIHCSKTVPSVSSGAFRDAAIKRKACQSLKGDRISYPEACACVRKSSHLKVFVRRQALSSLLVPTLTRCHTQNVARNATKLVILVFTWRLCSGTPLNAESRTVHHALWQKFL